MAKKSLTRDETYLIKLAKMAEAAGNKFKEFDRYVIGQAIGQNNRSVDNIVRMLAQTNFIKKGEDNNIYLTKNGEDLVADLLK